MPASPEPGPLSERAPRPRARPLGSSRFARPRDPPPEPYRVPGRYAPHSQPVSRWMLSTSGILAAWELQEPMAELRRGRRPPLPPRRRGRLVAPGTKATALAGSQAPEPRRSSPPTRDPGE